MKSIEHWSSRYVDEILKKSPNKELYVCAAGISPSGQIHFGNFRDVITSYAVIQELKKRGRKTKFIFSWDDFDRFRKVPKGVDDSFNQYIGMPLTSVPSPDGQEISYARYQEKEFEESMKKLNIDIEYRYQTDEYKSGRYDKMIIHAMKNRKQIADILLSFMSEKGKQNRNLDESEYRENYYPISVYSQFSGKDNTKVIDYDGDRTITYKCFDSGETATIDFTKEKIVKLSWKIDWAMRWKEEDVIFEPGGTDHSAPGGSYDTSSVIAREIYNIEPPIYQGYAFIGIRGLGDKMSGSSGNSITPTQLLEIYEPEILKWLYFRAEPNKSFTLAFDSEIYRQYAEFDKKLDNIDDNKTTNYDKSALELSGVKITDKKPIPFRQAVSFGQISQWNREKLLKFLEAMGVEYNSNSIDIRLEKAKSWLETYNRDEIIEVQNRKNQEFISQLSEEDLENVRVLKEKLENEPNMSIDDLDTLVYGIVKKDGLDKKEKMKKQQHFFKIIYNLIIKKDTGPRLSTFLWSIEDKNKILELLDI